MEKKFAILAKKNLEKPLLESKQHFKELRVKGFHFNEKEPLFPSFSTEKIKDPWKKRIFNLNFLVNKKKDGGWTVERKMVEELL